MEFPGTMTLSSETLERVYFEAAQSLIHHGFRRFLFLNSHAGNQYMTRFVVDRVNQETAAVAIDLSDGVAAMSGRRGAAPSTTEPFDRHGGVGVTSRALYLFPSLGQFDKWQQIKLTLPPHLATISPSVRAGDSAATPSSMAVVLKPS